MRRKRAKHLVNPYYLPNLGKYVLFISYIYVLPAFIIFNLISEF